MTNALVSVRNHRHFQATAQSNFPWVLVFIRSFFLCFSQAHIFNSCLTLRYHHHRCRILCFGSQVFQRFRRPPDWYQIVFWLMVLVNLLGSGLIASLFALRSAKCQQIFARKLIGNTQKLEKVPNRILWPEYSLKVASGGLTYPEEEGDKVHR